MTAGLDTPAQQQPRRGGELGVSVELHPGHPGERMGQHPRSSRSTRMNTYWRTSARPPLSHTPAGRRRGPVSQGIGSRREQGLRFAHRRAADESNPRAGLRSSFGLSEARSALGLEPQRVSERGCRSPGST
jgi:hypothetical protein